MIDLAKLPPELQRQIEAHLATIGPETGNLRAEVSRLAKRVRDLSAQHETCRIVADMREAGRSDRQ